MIFDEQVFFILYKCLFSSDLSLRSFVLITHFYLTSVFITNLTSSDTFVIKQNTDGWYLGNCHGKDSLHPLVFINEGVITINGGIGIENCSYLKVLGWGTGANSRQKGFTLTSGGTNGYIKALCKYIQVSGILNLNGVNGGWWIKLEAPEACNYPNPFDYLFPNTMSNIWFTHNQFGKSDGTGAIGGEAIYAISTGAYGRDQVPCLNNKVYKPLWGRNSNVIFNCGRSGIQLSGCYGTNTMNGNRIHRVGRELNSAQGAGIRTGYGTSDSTEIAYNRVINSYLYNYDIETGAIFHDNYGDSAGYYLKNKNPQAIPASIFSASLPNSHLKICSNKLYDGTSQPSTQYAIYGGANYAGTGNAVANNIGLVKVLSQPFKFSTDCGTIKSSLITQPLKSNNFSFNSKYLAAVLTPNPAKDYTSVVIRNATGNIYLFLKDINGKTVWQNSRLSGSNYDIPLKGINSGIYIVTVKDNDQQQTLKLLVAK